MEHPFFEINDFLNYPTICFGTILQNSPLFRGDFPDYYPGLFVPNLCKQIRMPGPVFLFEGTKLALAH